MPFFHLLGLTRSDRDNIGFNGKWSEPITPERIKERGLNLSLRVQRAGPLVPLTRVSTEAGWPSHPVTAENSLGENSIASRAHGARDVLVHNGSVVSYLCQSCADHGFVSLVFCISTKPLQKLIIGDINLKVLPRK